MSKKNYLVIIDTTESTRRRTLPRGILNTYVIHALDEYDARNILLKQFNSQVMNEVRDSIYVYDLEAMNDPLKQLDEQKAGFPGFAFMPWNGSRPPRQSEIPQVSTTNGNQTLSPTVNPQQQQAPAQPQRPVAPQAPRAPISAAGVSHSPRSREFQSDESNQRSTESRVLTEAQRRLIQGVGALSTSEGADEGTNLRVDTSTGTNSRQSTAGYPQPVVQLDPVRANLLKGLVPQSGPEIVEDPDLMAEIMEQRGGGVPLSNVGLDKVDDAPLSDEAIQQMNSELEKFK